MWRFAICFGLLAFQVQAKNLELKKDTRSIFIEEKENWTLGKDLFGMPFIYFSPQSHGQRSNISFTDTGVDFELDVKSLSSTQEKYHSNKKRWAEKVGATPLTFIPYEVGQNQHGHKIHKIGFTYQHEGKTYNEKSYYIECRGKVLYSKALRLSENEVHEKDFSDLIGSLDCGGV